MMPPVTIAPAHSRTYRSSRPALAASSATVAEPEAAASNRPVRCPMAISWVSTLPVSIANNRPPNSWVFTLCMAANGAVMPWPCPGHTTEDNRAGQSRRAWMSQAADP
jgi:hypothetical protein